MNDPDHEVAVAPEELMQLKRASQALLAEVRGLRALEETDGVRRPELRVVQGTDWPLSSWRAMGLHLRAT